MYLIRDGLDVYSMGRRNLIRWMRDIVRGQVRGPDAYGAVNSKLIDYDFTNLDEAMAARVLADMTGPVVQVVSGEDPIYVRFVKELMKGAFLAPRQVEMHRTTIGAASRKLVTYQTLLKAAQRVETELTEDNLVPAANYFNVGLVAWSGPFPAWRPQATATQRWALRSISLALSNVIMYPLFEVFMRLYLSGSSGMEPIRRMAEIMDRDGPLGEIAIRRKTYRGADIRKVMNVPEVHDELARYLFEYLGI